MTATEEEYRDRLDRAIEDYEEIVLIYQNWISEYSRRLQRVQERLDNLRKERAKQ